MADFGHFSDLELSAFLVSHGHHLSAISTKQLKKNSYCLKIEKSKNPKKSPKICMFEKNKYIEFWHPMWFTHLPLARKFHKKIPNGTAAPSVYYPVVGGRRHWRWPQAAAAVSGGGRVISVCAWGMKQALSQSV